MKKVWLVEELNVETDEVLFKQYYGSFEEAEAAYEERKQLNESTHLSLRKEEKNLLTE